MKVELNGNEYILDVEEAERMGLLKPMRQEGQHYKRKNEIYVLSVVNVDTNFEYFVALINIGTGVRYINPVKVFDPRNISQVEWKCITNDMPEQFTLIKLELEGF